MEQDRGDATGKKGSGMDYEGMPPKCYVQIYTYQELHAFINDLVKILEAVYELGIYQGSGMQYKY